MLRIFILLFSIVSLLHGAPPQKKETPPPASFTGKVVANKVRIRLKPDLESPILRQVNQGDLLLVAKEEGDFYAVFPPKDMKAYVFRSYVIDGVVEANRVNIRLEPHIDAPIVGQLSSGDKVGSQVSPLHHKWIEIPIPSSTYFYVSKEFINRAGGPDYLALMEKRSHQAEELLAAAYLSAEQECKKAYEEMSIQAIVEQFEHILQNFTDFPKTLTQAKEGLALLKGTYLQKKISFLEERAELSVEAKEELLAKHAQEKEDLALPALSHANLWKKQETAPIEVTDAMRFWDTLEESLYLSWSAFHSGKTIDAFYQEQKANATIVSGTLEPYTHTVKEKPGDFLLRQSGGPVAYLYSTHVDLAKHAGKEVSLLVAPRPNHHFAFPAYFVLAVE